MMNYLAISQFSNKLTPKYMKLLKKKLIDKLFSSPMLSKSKHTMPKMKVQPGDILNSLI
jgi:hypothetical protein